MVRVVVMKSVKFFLALLAIAAFSWQISDTWIDYFKYKTRSSVILKSFEIKKNIPKLGTCFGIASESNMILKELVDKYDPNFQWKAVTAWFSAYPQFGYKELDKYFIFEKFIKYHRYCLSIMLTNHLNIDFAIDYLFNIRLTFDPWENRTKNEYLVIHLSSVTESFYGQFSSPTYLNVFDPDQGLVGAEITVSYQLTENQLLEPPFDTDCHNYLEKSPFRSRSECIELCHLNKSLGRLGMFPMDVIVNVRDTKLQNVRRMTTLHYKNQSSVYRTVKAIEKECQSVVCPRLDCYSELYVPRLLQDLSFTRNHTSAKRVFIDFRKTTEHVIRTSAHEVVTLHDAITYSVSYLSFWFGICPLFLYSYIRDGVNEVRIFFRGKRHRPVSRQKTRH